MNITYRLPVSTCLLTLFIFLLLFAVGCSGSSPVYPDSNSSDFSANSLTQGISRGTNRINWGIWEFTIDTNNMQIDVLPIRAPQIHYNVLQMLEGWACKDCVKVPSFEWSPKGSLLVDVEIRHPYQSHRLDLTGRDVRGIVISDAVTDFPYHTVRNAYGVAVPLKASRLVLNPDGYTTHFNRETALEGKSLFNYKRGRLTHPSEKDIKGNLHPFKYFYTHEYKRLFYPNKSVTVTYDLNIKNHQFVKFAYSVDASWNLPKQWPVTNPLTAFDISTNSREAFQISMTVDNNQLTRQGGFADITFDVFDHQGYQSISTITIEAPDLFFGVIEVNPKAPIFVAEEVARYNVTVYNKTGYAKTADGGSDLLFVIEDVDMSIVGEDVRAYNIFTVPVTDPPKKWRPRGGTFQNLPFPGPIPQGQRIDISVIAKSQAPWAIKPGESMLIFNNDTQERYLAYNRNFDTHAWLAGYPGTSPSFLKSVLRLDAAYGGAFGVVSDSDVKVSGSYQIKHCTNMQVGGGVYVWSWFTGSMDDPIPYLEKASDVSGGFGYAPGDPIYSLYVFDGTAPPLNLTYQSLHRIEFPYNDYNKILRAFIPLTDNLTGTMPPFKYGVSYKHFVAMGVDDKPFNVFNPYTVHVYTAENKLFPPSDNYSEIDIWEINFTDPASPVWLRTYSEDMLGKTVVSPVDMTPRLVDIDVLPALANNIYLGDKAFAKNNWVAALFTFDIWAKWFVEIYDARLNDPADPKWKIPIYIIGPYSGVAKALDVDPANFEIYVLHDDLPYGSGNPRLTCLEYY